MEREKKESILKKWFISYTFWASTGGSSRATNLLINNAIIQCLNTWILQMKWNNNLKTTNCIRDVKWREKKTHTFGILMAICKKCTHSIIFNWNFCLRRRRKESKVWQSENDTRKWKCHLTFAHHYIFKCHLMRFSPPAQPRTHVISTTQKLLEKYFRWFMQLVKMQHFLRVFRYRANATCKTYKWSDN